eukprot:scaffold1484_cov241-Pinguiococcus_pyrenoidosus.AAC.13
MHPFVSRRYAYASYEGRGKHDSVEQLRRLRTGHRRHVAPQRSVREQDPVETAAAHQKIRATVARDRRRREVLDLHKGMDLELLHDDGKVDAVGTQLQRSSPRPNVLNGASRPSVRNAFEPTVDAMQTAAKGFVHLGAAAEDLDTNRPFECLRRHNALDHQRSCVVNYGGGACPRHLRTRTDQQCRSQGRLRAEERCIWGEALNPLRRLGHSGSASQAASAVDGKKRPPRHGRSHGAHIRHDRNGETLHRVWREDLVAVKPYADAQLLRDRQRVRKAADRVGAIGSSPGKKPANLALEMVYVDRQVRASKSQLSPRVRIDQSGKHVKNHRRRLHGKIHAIRQRLAVVRCVERRTVHQHRKAVAEALQLVRGDKGLSGESNSGGNTCVERRARRCGKRWRCLLRKYERVRDDLGASSEGHTQCFLVGSHRRSGARPGTGLQRPCNGFLDRAVAVLKPARRRVVQTHVLHGKLHGRSGAGGST